MDSLSLKACCVENDNYSLKILAENITQQMQAIDSGGQNGSSFIFYPFQRLQFVKSSNIGRKRFGFVFLREDPGVGAISEYPADTTTGFIFWTSLHRS